MKRFILPFLALLCLFTCRIYAQEQNIIYPAGANVFNVKDYGVKGDGITDDTKAIQALLDANLARNIPFYFPNGTYLVSNTLYWPPSSNLTTNCGNCWKRTVFQGQSETGVIIKLIDNAPGFNDPARPKTVIWTGTQPAQRFRNGLRNLTIHTGSGNPGAKGIQYFVSNQGMIEYVTIKSGDGEGVVGLDMDYNANIGPGLVKHLTVDGFNYGIKIRTLNASTLEYITVKNQKICGISNRDHMTAIRKLTSINTVKAVENIGNPFTNMILMDAELIGGGAGPAVTNAGIMYARNVSRSGYETLLDNQNGPGADVTGTSLQEWVSRKPTSPIAKDSVMLNLPIKETPEPAWETDTTQWVSPMDFGAVGNGVADDTQAIQAAIDAGKPIVYLPGGRNFRFNGTVYVRGAVRRIIGCEGRVQGTGTFVIQDGESPVISLERFDGIATTWKVLHEASRTLLLKGLTIDGAVTSTGSGDLFIEDVVCGTWRFLNPAAHVWARQFNAESFSNVNIINKGATVWLLMWKSEGTQTKIQVSDGSKTEILGFNQYRGGGSVPADRPCIDINNSSFSMACYRESMFSNPPTNFNIYVREVQGALRDTLFRAEAPEPGIGGRGIALYVARQLAPQTIVFPAIAPKKAGDAEFALNATSSVGLPVSYTSSDTTVATIANGKARITGIGTATITAYQEGDSTYSGAVPVSQVLTVLPLNLQVFYKDGDNGQLFNNTIRPGLTIANNDSVPVAYQELTARYWFTAENYSGVNTWIDYARLGNAKVKLRYVALDKPKKQALGYLEYSFDPSAGQLITGGNSGEIKSRAANTDWSALNEADDYSYLSGSSYAPNERITLYRNGILVWGEEPVDVDSVVSLKVYYQNLNSQPGRNTIRTSLSIQNDGNLPVSYKDIAVRYWFTSEGNSPLKYYLDYAKLGSTSIKGEFTVLDPVRNKADHYLELRIDSTAGTFYPLSTTGEIKYRIAKTDWSAFDETNDYSYQPAGTIAENTRITVYYKGQLVYGTEPAVAGANARQGFTLAQESSESQKVKVYPNPSGGVFIIEGRFAESPYEIELTNLLGQPVLVNPSGSSRDAVSVDIRHQARGIYLLRIKRGGTDLITPVKLIKE
jgi:hypothetical protein